ncbi:hypothetical protein [Teichococcus oryzae]|uniref:hypothetical protein n=1 Tax=Teichococcus oryzae TaxID=1608942 RepID=UPI00137590FC|nr:hypothetical protein [Pseudoroseomonas oryzae]
MNDDGKAELQIATISRAQELLWPQAKILLSARVAVSAHMAARFHEDVIGQEEQRSWCGVVPRTRRDVSARLASAALIR